MTKSPASPQHKLLLQQDIQPTVDLQKFGSYKCQQNLLTEQGELVHECTAAFECRAISVGHMHKFYLYA